MAQKLLQKFEEYHKNYGKTKGNNGALDTENDIFIIKKLINSQDYVIIPVYVDDTGETVSHFYTVGRWYYHQKPDIVIRLENNTKMIMEIMYYLVKIFDDGEGNNLITPRKIKEDEYMEIKAPYLMWFYMYYAELPKDTLYPVDIYDVKQSDLPKLVDIIINKIVNETKDK